MLFTLKKVIGGMLLPLPFLLFMIGLAIACSGLAVFRKPRKAC